MIEIQEYIAKFKDFPLLNAADERRLLVLIRTPPPGTPEGAKEWPLTSEQKEARDEFVCRNIRLVIHAAKKFCSLEDPRILDFVSSGVQGMLHSLDTFDITKGVRFSTYANWWIQAKIRTEIRVTDSKIIRYKTLHQQYKKLRNLYLSEGKLVLDERLFEELGWSDEEIGKFQEDQQRLKISLDTLESSANDFVSADDAILVDPPQEELLDDLHREEQSKLLRSALGILTKEQVKVISGRYALDGPEKTFDELAEEMGIVREKVRQIENKALAKLYRYMHKQAPSMCE